MKDKLQKFIPFVKVDNSIDPTTGREKRQVWGIVTAELPDKDREVCDYEGSKPFYQAVISEMGKATDGGNYFPLREMHGLSAAGKCIGFEFRDADKEIFMGFEVVDDVAWQKVKTQVYTGFSQGGVKVGEQLADPIYKGCMRYVANPSECSLVDNPCLAAAHFSYVKADGTTEIRKFKHVEQPEEYSRFANLEKEIALLKTQIIGKNKTKLIAGEELSSSAFAYVGKADDTKTWEFAIKFADAKTTKKFLRGHLATYEKSSLVLPEADRAQVLKRIEAAALPFHLDVKKEKARVAAIQNFLRKQCRIQVNQQTRLLKGKGGALAHAVSFLENDLGRLSKGMYEVSRLAECVSGLGYLLYGVVCEQEYEGDDESPLPELLAANVNGLLDTLIQMAQEEAEEMRDEIAVRVA